MYLPDHHSTNKYRNYINAFGGYNHNPVISEAELYDMRNMTADRYPVLSSRDPRGYKLHVASDIYERITPKLTVKFVEESLSIVYVSYVLEFDVIEGEVYRLQYIVEESVGKCDTKVYFKCNTSVVRAETDLNRIRIPEGCQCVKIEITAVKKAEAEWSEEHAELYVTSIELHKVNETIRGMIMKNGNLAYMIRDRFYWKGHDITFPLEVTDLEEPQQLLSFGAYILIFPLGLYVNTQNMEDYGFLGARKSLEEVTYSVCGFSGGEFEYTLSESAPKEPKDGEYWMRKSEEGDALYRWSEVMSMWSAVGTTYVKIKAGENDFDEFDIGDAIHVENASVKELNGINSIVDKGKDYIVVTGIIRESVTQKGSVIFERKIPNIDHACISGNRVWGCHYGDGLNEIYACKLGDPKNWNSFQGTSIDSYAISLGDDGEFTGACNYQGYPMFFKENSIYKIYGNYPAAYQMTTYHCRGCQKGSAKSIVVIDEYLVYKSRYDICVFAGGYPTSISAKLGKEIYTDCVAGAVEGKYYVSMKDSKGEYSIFVYDFKNNLWVKDESMRIEEFAGTPSGELYGRTKLGIFNFGTDTQELGLEKVKTDEVVEWSAEFGTYGFDTPEKKYVKEIRVRAAIDFGARLKLEVYYDDSNSWNEYWIDKSGCLGDGKIRTYKVPIVPVCCDLMKMRISGVGRVDIYSLNREVEEAT